MKSLEDILNRLADASPHLQETYHVDRLGVFGSTARGEAEAGSDVDIVVEFSHPIGLDFVSLADELEQILGEKVGRVTN